MELFTRKGANMERRIKPNPPEIKERVSPEKRNKNGGEHREKRNGKSI